MKDGQDKSSLEQSQVLPFATATIARLYMSQGKLAQSEAIYRRLLDESPDDSRLLSGLAEVQRRSQAKLLPLAGGDRVELVWQGAELRCKFVVTEEGERRARLVLKGAGELVVRLHAFPQRGETPPLDQPLPGTTGEIELAVPQQAKVLAAAVGLRQADRFVAIAHCCTASE
jgi:hypothetical protein